MNRRITVAVLLAFALSVQPIFADFSGVARGLSNLGFERTWMPFLGVARTLVRIVQPRGVSDFQIAMYENSPRVSGSEIEQMLRSRVGRGFTPLVRVFSARARESVFVYARPSRNGRSVELIVLTHEPGETVLVRVTADAEMVGRQLGVPEKMREIASR